MLSSSLDIPPLLGCGQHLSAPHRLLEGQTYRNYSTIRGTLCCLTVFEYFNIIYGIFLYFPLFFYRIRERFSYSGGFTAMQITPDWPDGPEKWSNYLQHLPVVSNRTSNVQLSSKMEKDTIKLVHQRKTVMERRNINFDQQLICAFFPASDSWNSVNCSDTQHHLSLTPKPQSLLAALSVRSHCQHHFQPLLTLNPFAQPASQKP